jgi:hypothetical protein
MWTRTAQATEFTTDDVKVELYSDQFRGMQSVQPISIRWNFELEMRDWGIKNTYVSVPDQDVTLVFEVEKELEDNDFEYEQQEKVIQLTNVQADFGDAKWGHSLVPVALSEYNGKWTLEFAAGE